LPPARTFYERELGEMRRRESRGWVRPKAGCPFHTSKSKASFSVNLTNGHWHCFGCDAGGGIVDFVMRRYGLGFVEAVKSLGAWDDLQGDRELIRRIEAGRRRFAEEKQAEIECIRRRRMAARARLHRLYEIHRQSDERLGALCRGAEPAFDGEEETHWSILQLVAAEILDAEPDYSRKAGLA
jgi:hypothetical protein